jgi:aminoglycoside 3-N-acetyltransferase
MTLQKLKNTLKKEWSSCGIDQGDTLLLHSDCTRILWEFRKEGITPQIILDVFLEILGHQGTLLLPTFNFNFCDQVPFSISTTPSQMGILSEIARLKMTPKRSKHPVYSFVAFGKDADIYNAINNNSAYEEISPFGILKQNNAKIALLDLNDQKGMTFYHHIEESLQVPYRYFKTFSADYEDEQKNNQIASYQIYVRDLEKGITTSLHKMEKLCWKEGICKGYPPLKKWGLKTVKAQELFKLTKHIIDQGKAEGMLYVRQ